MSLRTYFESFRFLIYLTTYYQLRKSYTSKKKMQTLTRMKNAWLFKQLNVICFKILFKDPDDTANIIAQHLGLHQNRPKFEDSTPGIELWSVTAHINTNELRGRRKSVILHAVWLFLTLNKGYLMYSLQQTKKTDRLMAKETQRWKNRVCRSR
jgi:hypothetical protein